MRLSENFNHMLHIFVTWLDGSGVGICEVKKLLGHGSTMVSQVRSHLVTGEHLEL
jgi:hypothetical protein